MTTEFEEKVYQALKRVPRGKITTYGELARAVRTPGGARAIGNAMNKNPYTPKVPCHRVVKSDGGVGGFASGTKKKILMLRREGILVRDGKIVDFDAKLYLFV